MPTVTNIEQLIPKVLEEAVSKIVEKISEGEKLSDKEVAVFVMSLMMRRFENLKVYINGKFNSVERKKNLWLQERRIDVLQSRLNIVHGEVS